MKIRRVVIVGRPNVGKSTLFNRLTGRKRALVHDQPGVTRDWISAPADLGSGREAELIDTGGLDLADRERFAVASRKAALGKFREADVLLFVVDGADGVSAGDFEVADLIRPLGRPVVLAVNKCDTKKAQAALHEFYAFGFGEPVPVSAEHGRGQEDVCDAIIRMLPEGGGSDRPAEGAPKVAIVGRPNVGKSSLANRLLGSERMIVSEVPGTTRDSVDTVVHVQKKSYVLVDTAGIRHRTRTAEAPDVLASILAVKSLERCDVAVLVIDAKQGVTTKDANIAGKIVEARRPVVILGNKWDLRGVAEKEAEAFFDDVRRELPMLDYAEIVLVSAVTGRRTGEIWKAVDRAIEAGTFRVPTAELNRWLEKAVSRGPAFTVGGVVAKLKYAAQVGVSPPTFAIFTNRKGPLSPNFSNYLENRLREKYPFSGSPVIFRTVGPK